MTYREIIQSRAALEASKMHGQAVKSSAKVLILVGLLGGLAAVRQQQGGLSK